MDAVPHVVRPFQDVGVLCSRDKLPPILTCRGDAGYRISFPFAQRNKPRIGRIREGLAFSPFLVFGPHESQPAIYQPSSAQDLFGAGCREHLLCRRGCEVTDQRPRHVPVGVARLGDEDPPTH